MWRKKYGTIAPDAGLFKISIWKVAGGSQKIPSVRSCVTRVATRWLPWIPRDRRRLRYFPVYGGGLLKPDNCDIGLAY